MTPQPGEDPPMSADSPSIVDSHVHLWDPELLRYPWLDEASPIRRPFLPTHLREHGCAHELLVVQGETHPDDGVAEAEWINRLAGEHREIVGMVVRAPVECGRTVSETLDQLRELPLTVGVRRLIQNQGLGFAT